MNAVDIRRMRIEDAGEIGAISEAITQKPADVDFKKVNEARFRFDVAGHYGRPDVFSLTVNRERQQPIR